MAGYGGSIANFVSNSVGSGGLPSNANHNGGNEAGILPVMTGAMGAVSAIPNLSNSSDAKSGVGSMSSGAGGINVNLGAANGLSLDGQTIGILVIGAVLAIYVLKGRK